jgi:hypothetical protein
MRNEYILDVVDKILNLNDIHANRKKLFKVLFSSPVFPSLASILEECLLANVEKPIEAIHKITAI